MFGIHAAGILSVRSHAWSLCDDSQRKARDECLCHLHSIGLVLVGTTVAATFLVPETTCRRVVAYGLRWRRIWHRFIFSRSIWQQLSYISQNLTRHVDTLVDMCYELSETTSEFPILSNPNFRYRQIVGRQRRC